MTRDEADLSANSARPIGSVETTGSEVGRGSSGYPTRTSGTADTAVASSAADARPPAPLQPRDPGRYQILAEHGRGGLGRIYRARDKEFGRDVALKELLQPSHPSELRFLREALITARLEHPGIVPVHEAGRWPDVHHSTR